MRGGGGGIRHYHGGRGRGRKLILGYQHKVTAPSSTEKIIIFPMDRIKGQFDLNFYDPAMTRGKISREEIAEFAKGLDPMVKPIFKSKMNSFLKGYQAVYPFLFLLVAIGFIIGIFMGIRSGSFSAFFIAPVVFAIFWLSLVVILIINCSHVAGVKRKLEEAKSKIMPLVSARNPEFQRKGYFWVAPHNFPYWIELWADGAPQGVSMERQYGIPMIEQIPYYYPAPNSNQISPMDYSP